MSAPNTITLGGNTFAVPQLPALDSFDLQTRLIPPIAEIIGSLGRAGALSALMSSVLSGEKVDIGGMDLDGMIASAGPSLAAVFGKMGRGELRALLQDLLGGVTMDGKSLFGPGLPVNLLLIGRTVDLWKLAWFAVKVNYPDFFSLLGAGRTTAPAPARSEE